MKIRLTGAILALGLLTAACAASEEPAAEAPAPAPAAPAETEEEAAPEEEPSLVLPELTTVRMANVAYFGPEYVAIDQGFDEKYNLNIEIIQAASLGVPGVQAVAAGQVETFQSVGFDAWFKSINAGVDLTGIISGQISGGDFDVYRYYVREDSGIEGPEDLVGKTMGIAAVGSYGDVPMDLYLTQAGLDPSDVTRIAVPPSEIPAALINGQIDVAAAFSNLYAVLDTTYEGQARSLFRDRDVLPVDEFVTAYGFSTQYIAENPAVIAAFVAAIKDGVAFIQENPEEAREIISGVTGAPAEGLIIPAYPEGLCLDLTHLEDYRDVLIDLEYLPAGSLPGITSNFTNEYNDAC